MNTRRYTDRTLKLFELSKVIANENNMDYVNSITFFIASLRFNKSILKELNEIYMCKINELSGLLNQDKKCETRWNSEIKFYVSNEFNEVLNLSNEISKTYSQPMTNEGNVIEAILKSDSKLALGLKEVVNVQKVLKIASRTRDMLVNLSTIEYALLLEPQIVTAREVKHDELLNRIEHYYGERWLASVNYSLNKNDDMVFVAKNGNEIIGFATFDSGEKRKGVFGPMAVFGEKRNLGVGKSLLYHTLNCMKNEGYQYAVIGNVGPIEFYEKSCNATLIPIKV